MNNPSNTTPMRLQYLVKEPAVKLDKNPLLLLLHGYGSNEKDLFSFASELPNTYYIISAQAPHDMLYDSYAWYAINFDADENKFSDLNQARESRDLIVNFIEELKAQYPIDADNVTLLGFSQGAILSYSIALSYPEKVKNVIALSGYLMNDIIAEDAAHKDVSHLNIFASHGTVDQVIPVDWARKGPEVLKNKGINITYKEYPVGHGVAPQNFFDLRNWLEQH
jgi:phospholipase/carboxylesterase